MDYQELLNQVLEEVRPVLGQGKVASYIPALARVDPGQFGMALATVDGELFGVGDWRTPFSIQSISKVFTLALVLARDGDALWRRVGKEPSGNPFNSLVQLEYEHGIPRNPFINAGALVITDRLSSLTGDARGVLREFLRAESGNPSVDFDPVVAASEAEHGHRNAALAHFMAGYGNIENPVPNVLEHYFWQCSLAMSCADLARACGFLARHGRRVSGERLLTRSQAKQVNAIMLTCGTYDAAGEFAYRVGLPGKSGVGGGIVAIIPNRCGLCVWSPGLDARGNSVAGVEALDRFTTLTGLSVF
ncbi:L-glutaminase [Archangium gephyra]|uniref:Glutaminase n=1 Tax=Archangium gephyra TaxID=48 RepID=A0AAC8Q8H7_9BACT|nr:glutaminase [Archangium gephyra]AKJ02483.1 Glutaminase [Archangium gephyra]REG28595.1 L-glutaminase [Archangium gephyra]